jgi:hypothetical protein
LSGESVFSLSGDVAQDLLGRCVPGSKEGGSEAVALGREGVAVRLGYLADEAVSAKQANAATTAPGDLAAVLRGRISSHGVQEALEVTVTEACRGELATGDGLQQTDTAAGRPPR